MPQRIPFNPAEITSAVLGATAEIVRGCARAGLEVAVLATPVGNPDIWQKPAPLDYVPGGARGNWRVDIDNDNPAYDPNDLDTTGARTIVEGVQKIDTYTRAMAQRGARLYVQNGTPYIDVLESGEASTQGDHMAAKGSVAASHAFNERRVLDAASDYQR